MSAALLDCTLRFGGLGDYRDSATFCIDDRDLRVRLCRDDDRGISFAVAELLDDELRWTRLAEAGPPPATSDGRGTRNVIGGFEHFARELAGFAFIVLACAERTR